MDDTLRWLASEWNSRAQAGAHTKAIAIVECDESQLTTTLPHLLSLRPKSIIGPFTNAKFREYAAGDSVDTPMFAPTIDDTLLVDQPDSRRRVYSCAPNLNLAVKPFQRAAALVAELVASKRSKTEVKVVLVKTSDEADQAFLAKFEDGLQLNGQPAAGQSNYKVISMTTAINSNAAPTLVQSAQAVALEKADLVVLSAGVVAAEFITSTDNRWPGINQGQEPPAFLLMGRYSRVEESFAAVNKKHKERFFAVDWVGNSTTDDNYTAVASDLLSRSARTGPSVARTADCGLLAAYAALAGASSANTSMVTVNARQYLDGVGVATTGDNAINVKSDTIATAVSLLGNSPPIKTKLIGTINPSIVFAPNGTLGGTSALYCMSSDTASPAQVWTRTGMTFAETGVENGSIACP
ncbi:hypothetical protein AKJ09_10452 [Labilithrix luteola]|uniref:Uncharacterized protein n=1 Tax=Labilithrix luteola TaxID=1391654 RepID=A0A0K1QDF4_9BACT|nr:hypothetical protein AKJ09_10452 [Labilithrix luteola]